MVYVNRVINDSVLCIVSSIFSRRKRSVVNVSIDVIVLFDGFILIGSRGIFVFIFDFIVIFIELDEVFFG